MATNLASLWALLLIVASICHAKHISLNTTKPSLNEDKHVSSNTSKQSLNDEKYVPEKHVSLTTTNPSPHDKRSDLPGVATDKGEHLWWVSQYTGTGSRQTQTPIDTAGTTRDLQWLLRHTGSGPAQPSSITRLPKDDDSMEELVDKPAPMFPMRSATQRASKKDYRVNNAYQPAQPAQPVYDQANEDGKPARPLYDQASEDDIAIKEGMLAHNSFRLLHHVQPLQWNETLADEAQRIAKTIANDPESFQGESPGENIAQIWHDFPHAPLKASNIWYSERKDYSFAYPTYSDKTRHFSQMVWKGTSQVGLGLAMSPSEKYKIVVALYWPLGNDPHPKELVKNIPKPGGGPDVYATLKWRISRPINTDQNNLQPQQPDQPSLQPDQ
ncbi:uncharacterized protein LOC116613264 isoform X3 [Nematostella vectensis]|uniref:uncharacterized protein LOC116613264 isoform X3 n=1 Tax=Nematostella vectensis TaxID=45351 RepID=UPI0020775310|nr:uncharacterized protein LOC116613264 isoform X3 [Nematostella vectensis]